MQLSSTSAYRELPTKTNTLGGYKRPVFSPKPIASGAVPVSSSGGTLDWTDLTADFPLPSATDPGAITAGSAGNQVMSGSSGSHDTVGINGGAIETLGGILSVPSDSTPTAVPTAQPTDGSGAGTIGIVIALVIAAWIIFK
jgi:hypothetical protein